MKKILCCFTLLFIVVGCKKDNPNAQPTPDPVPGKPFTNSIGMKLVYIPPGECMMGSRDSAAEVAGKTGIKPEYLMAEHPQHRVKITNGFFMGSTEVTQAQYAAIMGTNPSYFEGEDNPVEMVSWNGAVEFYKRLSRKEGKKYRLPTEAEWEYACRAGTTTPFLTGETISTSHANYDGIRTTSVGSFSPNAFGLYDMHGNVWEWCQDWYGENYYAASPVSNPQGPSSGKDRVVRGGDWSDPAENCRVAFRRSYSPGRGYFNVGFRLLLDL